MDYKAVFHIDMDEEKPFHLGLLNITNLIKGIPGEPHDLIMLFNGPAVNLLVEAGLVETIEQIQALQQIGVRFIVCNNALERYDISPGEIVEGVDIVPAGIVTLVDLQNQGFAYIKP